jgi:hypothetical protein
VRATYTNLPEIGFGHMRRALTMCLEEDLRNMSDRYISASRSNNGISKKIEI